MADWEISQLAVRSSPAATDYVPLLVTSDTSTPPADAFGSDQRATVPAVTQAGMGLTALGDVSYGGASGVPTRLAGNTAATRKFLRQLGTGSVSAAPAWDVLTAADLPSGTVTSLAPSGVTSGATDAAAIEAARAALSGGPGLIRLSPGTWYVSGGVIAALVSGQYIDATGCYINAKGSGDIFNWSDSSTYSARTVHGGGILGFPTIDGTTTTGNSTGVHAGDILFLKFYCTVQNFTAGTTSRCFKFDNRWAITEQLTGIIRADNGTGCVEFTQTPNVANTFCFGSFERANLGVFINQGLPANNGIIMSAGTYMDNSVLTAAGNFGGSASVLTSAAFTLTGSTPANSQDGAPGAIGSNMNNMTVNIGMECEANTHTPFTFVVDAGSGCFAGNLFGALHFGAAGNTFASTSAVISFFGATDGDPAIVAQVLQPFLFQGQLSTGTFASPTVLAGSGTVSTAASWAIVAPAAAVTGIIMQAGAWDGQLLTLWNKSAFSVTFAAAGTSNVTGGAGDVVPAGAAVLYQWSVSAALWGRVSQQHSTAVVASGGFTSANAAGAQNVTGMSAVLGAGTWKVRGWFPYVGAGTIGSTQTFAFTFGGTASGASYISWNNHAAAYSAPVMSATVTTGITTATITSTVYYMEFTATIVVTAAGTLQLTTTNTVNADRILIEGGAFLETSLVA